MVTTFKSPIINKKDEQKICKLIYNAVKDGWTVKMLDNGKIELTIQKSRLKQKVDFNSDKYVSKLLTINIT